MHARYSVCIPRSVGYRGRGDQLVLSRSGALRDAVEIPTHSIGVAQRSSADCAIMIMYKVSTSARRSSPTHSLITSSSCPWAATRIITARHKVDQTLIDDTVTVKERHVPLQF
jgi:hypothetical protein